MSRASTPQPVLVPHDYPTATIFIDESGSKTTANKCFVVAAVKCRRPGRLARDIKAIRDRYSFDSELKFARISGNNVNVFFDVIDALEASDAHLAACVVNGNVFNPFKGRKAVWKVHAEVTAQLLVGCINRRELVGVVLDGISTPAGDSLEEEVRRLVNRRFKNTSVVSAIAADSRSSDLLQAADLVAGAIFHERTRQASAPRKLKGRVSLRLATAFEVPTLADQRVGRVNIDTYQGTFQRASGLHIVRKETANS